MKRKGLDATLCFNRACCRLGNLQKESLLALMNVDLSGMLNVSLESKRRKTESDSIPSFPHIYCYTSLLLFQTRSSDIVRLRMSRKHDAD